MDKTADIHNYKRILERVIERIDKELHFSESNRKISLDFKNDLLANNISLSKTSRYLQDIIWLNKNLNGKDFEDIKKEDIKNLVARMNQGPLSEETKKGIKIMLRKFFKFIRGVEGKGNYPEEVNWFTVNISNGNSKLPEELLTEEEMSKIIKFCKCERDRALISTLCESGCRIGEIGFMRIKHVSFEEHGARITVDGKTGMRKILVINSAPYLQTWINHHSRREDLNSPLWPKSDGSLLSYARISHIIREAVKGAGIKKRVYPHLLRHSRATIMARSMTESTMKHYFGWTQSSKMASVYVHMSGKDTDQAILEANGIIINKEKKESKMKPIECPRCSRKNEFSNKFCNSCGLPLDKQESNRIINEDHDRQRADEVMNQLIKDPEILELIKKKLS